MIATVHSCSVAGAQAYTVGVEVSISKGVGCHFTGLAGEEVKESLARIAVVLEKLGYRMPHRRLVINLTPAHLRKSGTSFDVPVALGILLASGQIIDTGKLDRYLIAGEMGLDETVHPVKGALCMAGLAADQGYHGFVVPAVNAAEALLQDEVAVFAMKKFKDVVAFISADVAIEPLKPAPWKTPVRQDTLDYHDIIGQQQGKRAMEIVAAGGHHCIMSGAPGIGKTSLAKRLPTILPMMTKKESLQTTGIYSLLYPQSILTVMHERPFRTVHSTVTEVGLTGGGRQATPGEISLAHNGVLFLDELPEFKLSVLDSLRQPLENRQVLVARAGYTRHFPASFILVASMNPCSCGFLGHPLIPCSCSCRARFWYRRKVSGPLLDRIDLHISVEPVAIADTAVTGDPAFSSAAMRARVLKARQIQHLRFSGSADIFTNAQMNEAQVIKYCAMEEPARRFLLNALRQYQLSARGYHNILKVARTIADLAGASVIELPHIVAGTKKIFSPVSKLSCRKVGHRSGHAKK